MSGAQYAALLGLWVAGIVIPGPDIFLILRNAFLSTRRNALFTALGIMVGNATWITLSLMGVTVLISGNHVLKLVVQIAGALFLARMGYSSLRGGLAERAARGPGGAGTTGSGASAASGTGAIPGGGTTVTTGPGSGTGPAAGPDVAWGLPGDAAADPLLAEDAVMQEELAEQGRKIGFLGTANLTPWRAVGQGTVTNLANAKAVVFFVALFGSVVPSDILWWEGLAVLGLLVAVGLVWFLAVAWAGSIPRLASLFRERTAEVEMVSGIVFLVVAAGLLVEALLAL